MDQAVLTRSLLYLDGISVTFDGYKALRGLSLTLQPGEMRAIIGPNGAGKTTLFNLITGIFPSSAGQVLQSGQKLDVVLPLDLAVPLIDRSQKAGALRAPAFLE